MSNQSPNILLVIADDVSPPSLQSVNTPNIDELAQDGIVFENAWATPECSPTRATIATGRYGFRTGIGNAVGRSDPGLDPGEVTIAEALDADPDLNYSEAVIGKWHLGGNGGSADEQGYDYYAGNESGALRDYDSWTKIIKSDSLPSDLRTKVDEYATTETVNDAIEWLNGDKADIPNLDDPWFLQLAFNAPHTPYHKPPNELLVDPEYLNLPDTPEDIEANPEPYYEAAIQALDTEVGRLLEFLDGQGELEETLIIFIGDNGSPSEVAQDPDRAKSTLYEGGIKIPAIVSGHGVVRGDGTEDSLVNTTDLFATIVELAGSDEDIPADSVSLVPYLNNQINPNEREWVLSEYFDESNDNTFGGRRANYGQAIRNQEYKLIRFQEDGREELYTLGPLGEFDERSQSELLQGDVNNLTPVQRQNYEFLVNQLEILNESEPPDNPVVNQLSELAEDDSPDLAASELAEDDSSAIAVSELESNDNVITVTTNLDDLSGGTLREAIAIANSDPNRDRIVFDRSLRGQTIELNPTLGSLEVTEDLQLLGFVTPEDLTISGVLNAFDAFTVSNNAELDIRNLTITNGDKGVSLEDGSQLKVSNSIIRNNNDGLFGENNNFVEVIDSTFRNNNDDGLDFTNNNEINVSTSTFNDNAQNGFLLGSDNAVTVQESTFSDQTESGIYVIGNNSQISIEDSLFTRNQFSGIDITQPQSNTTNTDGNTVRVRNSEIIDNIAPDTSSGVGGGILNDTDNLLIVEDSLIANNIAEIDGGGIFNAGNTTVTRSFIVGNEAEIGEGGGVFNLEGSSFTNNNSLILDNTPDNIFI